MTTMPTRFAAVILCFARLFGQRSWRWAEPLLIGAILVPGRRTVASVLRVLGLSGERHFVNYHRVLSRAAWSPRVASRVLLRLLVSTFVRERPIVLGIDDTLERRRGARIAAKGIYRDPVRSSHSHFVKASGLRWLSLMLLAPIPWARRVWALPVLTALAPSERHIREQGRRHKRLTDWARQMLLQLHRWLPGRRLVLVVVADSSFAALDLPGALASRTTCITRLRLDAQLYAPVPPRPRGTPGRPRKKGARQPTLSAVLADGKTRWQRLVVPRWYAQAARCIEIASGTAVWVHAGRPVLPIRWVLIHDPLGPFDPQALLCTQPGLAPLEVVEFFVQRWQVEVTFEEVRRHLGVETQRQWSALAIARTTPVLLALYSLVTLLATRLLEGGTLPIRQAAWYRKTLPTFSEGLAAVRRHWWHSITLSTSTCKRDIMKVPRRVLQRLHEAACYAA